ncbi:uncharacterized protein LOC120338115 [Styela clava]
MKRIIATFFLILVYGASAIEEGSIRIIFGSSGIFQIYHDKKWGGICADNILKDDKSLANVACRMAGYKRARSHMFFTHMDHMPMVLQNVSCNGNERNIDQCQRVIFGEYSCNRAYGANCHGKSSEHVCGGRVCDDEDKFCCNDGFSNFYCCDEIEPTTTSKSDLTSYSTSTISWSHETNFRLSIWWTVCIALAIFVAIAFVVCRLRRRSRRLHQNTQSRTTERHNTSSRSTSSTQYEGRVNRALDLPSDTPPEYASISKYECNFSVQPPPYPVSKPSSEPPPPPYTVSHTENA